MPCICRLEYVHSQSHRNMHNPGSMLYKSIAGRYRPVRVSDGPITARCRFIKNASWELARTANGPVKF